MRIGFICGNKDIIQKVVVVKQVNDVHTNIFFQILAARFIERYGLDEHIAFIRQLYRNKAHLMLDELEKTFDGEIDFTHPQGGLFLGNYEKRHGFIGILQESNFRKGCCR